MSRPHHDLRVWQDAMAMVTKLYKLARTFPDTERFGLIAQMRRAAVSVPSNIAEGAARGGKKEFIQFLTIAKGSLSELDTQLRIAANLGFADHVESLLDEFERLQAMLASLIKSQRVHLRT
jgi:four helix bundle protein